MKSIGILGGTFDPIHLGHLHLAEEIYKRLSLQEVRFIPTYLPVHRNIPNASASDRLAMVKLAVENLSGMAVDDREIRRQGPSYMIDTLRSMREEIPDSALYLIMATDAFAGFDKWHRWQDILNYAHIIVANRPETSLGISAELKEFCQKHQTKHSQQLLTKPHGYIYFLDIPELSISGTEIREQIAAGLEPKNLLPTAVWEYIKKYKLYSEKRINNNESNSH